MTRPEPIIWKSPRDGAVCQIVPYRLRRGWGGVLMIRGESHGTEVVACSRQDWTAKTRIYRDWSAQFPA